MEIQHPSLKFRNYELIARLGTGDTAEVFLARPLGLGGFDAFVAVKRILPHRAADTAFVRRFLDGVQSAAHLKHPNLAEVYEVGLEQGVPYVVMEYVRGPSLAALLRAAWQQQKPHVGHIAKIVSGICEGLHHAHQACGPDGAPLGLVHGDVRPQNILVTVEGVPKLCEFGMTSVLGPDGGGATSLPFKHRRYNAPEMVAEGAIDRRADVYSLGVSLFEATTGQDPLGESTEMEGSLLHRILSWTGEKAGGADRAFPPELAHIVLWAVQPQVEKRCQTARDLHVALEGFTVSGPHASHARTLVAWMNEIVPARMQEAVGPISSVLPTPSAPTRVFPFQPNAALSKGGPAGLGVGNAVPTPAQRITWAAGFSSTSLGTPVITPMPPSSPTAGAPTILFSPPRAAETSGDAGEAAAPPAPEASAPTDAPTRNTQRLGGASGSPLAPTPAPPSAPVTRTKERMRVATPVPPTRTGAQSSTPVPPTRIGAQSPTPVPPSAPAARTNDRMRAATPVPPTRIGASSPTPAPPSAPVTRTKERIRVATPASPAHPSGTSRRDHLSETVGWRSEQPGRVIDVQPLSTSNQEEAPRAEEDGARAERRNFRLMLAAAAAAVGMFVIVLFVGTSPPPAAVPPPAPVQAAPPPAPVHVDSVKLYLDEAEKLIAQRRLDPAQELLAKAREIKNQDPMQTVRLASLGDQLATLSLLRAANRHVENGDRQAALNVAIQALDRDPGNSETVQLLQTIRESINEGREREKATRKDKAAKGILSVESDPHAQVFLDAKPLGRTPMRERKVEVGEHVLALRVPGYKTAESAITVSAGKPLALVVPLVPETRRERADGGIPAAAAARALEPSTPPAFVPDKKTKNLPAEVGAELLLIDPAAQAYRPAFPVGTGRVNSLFQVCVNREGKVDSVRVVRGSDPQADPLIVAKMKTYRYLPYLIESEPVPFCTPVAYASN